MAVPFAMPEEDINDLIRMVIAILSQARMNQNDENLKMLECMEQLMKLLVEEVEKRSRLCNYDHHLRQGLNLLRQGLEAFPRPSTATTIIHSPRRRTSSESSFCDEKLTKTEVRQDIDQMGLMQRLNINDFKTTMDAEIKPEYSSRKYSIWRLLRESIRASIWKAMPILCVVGWHLFQSTSSYNYM